jgi:hypothetical protein
VIHLSPFFQNGLLQSQLALSPSNNAFQQLTIKVDTNNVTTVNGAPLPAALSSTVGVIYVLNTVLTPPSKSIVQTAVDGGFSKLVSAVTLARTYCQLSSTRPRLVTLTLDLRFLL